MVELFEKEMRREVRNNLTDKHKQVGSLTRWAKYRTLKDSSIPKPEVVVKDIEDVAKFNLKLAVGFALLLLTGSRAQEITRYKYVWVKNNLVKDNGVKIPLTYEKYKELKDVTGETITKHAVRFGDVQTKETEDGKKWVVIRTRVEKYHDVQNNHYKYAWLLYDESEYYFPLLRILEEYMDSDVPNKDNPNTELFSYSHNHLREKVGQYLGLTPHIMRNYTAKYLVWYKHFTVQDLMKWFNWKGPEEALMYSASDERTIQNRMLGLDLGSKS